MSFFPGVDVAVATGMGVGLGAGVDEQPASIRITSNVKLRIFDYMPWTSRLIDLTTWICKREIIPAAEQLHPLFVRIHPKGNGVPNPPRLEL